jgi:mono/diheme cytochrome c family protein
MNSKKASVSAMLASPTRSLLSRAPKRIFTSSNELSNLGSDCATDLVMIPVRYRFFCLLLVALLMLAMNVASAGSKQIQRGRALYLQYCVSCHGPSAQGDGPVARALSTPPANLRRLAERFGNPLPEDQVARYIDGRAEVKAHGPRDMPVWGARFYYKSGTNERRAQEWIGDLVAFLQSIQTPIRNASLS